ncbi:BnaA03g57750D [Brassica napus]|uniref:BnaA03g57750D protein n=1 Tax=Brassica napus TaxID=3708 RepID=A0A078IQR9_BRANA|nr:BnaA03g57750D [Brassica napus]
MLISESFTTLDGSTSTKRPTLIDVTNEE